MEELMRKLSEPWMSTHYRFVCVLCLTLQVVFSLDQVTLLNPPVEPLPDYLLKIRYSCDEPATVQLDCIVSFDTGNTSTHPLRQWSCDPADPKIEILELRLPDWLVYQADGIVPEYHGVLSCILLVSVRHSGSDVAAQDVATLHPKPFFNRPVKQHRLCLPWGTKMLLSTQQFSMKQCPAEQETVHLLSSIYASTGETFGITKTLEPYSNEYLEYVRLKAISFPWCMFTMWIFVTRHCRDEMCGLLNHIDLQDNYVSPTIFLKASGHLHIQIKGESDESAFLSLFEVPLREWCQISLMLQGRTVTVSKFCIDEGESHSTEFVSRHSVELDDTDGYFVIGGGKYSRGVEGYFGPLVYYRNRMSPHSTSEAVIPHVIRTVNLTGWLEACEAFHLDMTVKIRGYSLVAKQEIESAVSGKTRFDVFHAWMVKSRLPSEAQCRLWEETVPHRREAAKLAMFLAFKQGGRVSPLSVGRALYSLSLHKLDKTSSPGVISRIVPLLLQAGCLADTRALHMASVLYSSGLGVRKHLSKAWLLALLAAQNDDRVALLNLGHAHHQGLHGLPTDPDLAYAYYANIAKQTTLDRVNPSPQQTFVEAVYLNNDEVLNLQTNEEHHIFQWLKLQARRGAAEAEQSLARMLFWGQQGVSPNVKEAVKHYQRGAVQLKDPASMYDYGIVLLQGQGVEQDIPRAITFLNKAMEQGFVPAINALAWYYEQFKQDYRKAVELWERADELGCPEAALNLGVVYSQGLYPGKPADRFMAYQYYLKSADRGHIRGGIQLADIWITGIPGRVARRPADAVLWVKWAAEQSGYLGNILRKALNSYLEGDMFPSLLYYMMAAESGFAAAQFNVAYLCEQHATGLLDPDFASQCMWRYYNLTIQSQNPDPYALNRMGDLLYEGQGRRQKDLFSAAEMYTQAAARNDPQGWYNLGVLVEEGFRLPLSVLTELGLSELYLADDSLLLSALYKRCRNLEDTDSYLPCSLALVNVYLQSFQREYRAVIKWSTAVAVVVAPTIFLIIFGVQRRPVLSLN